jgi:3-dehydroquinate synthase
LVRELVEQTPRGLLVLLSDSTVGPLHAEPLRDALRAGGLQAELLTFPAGERNKNRRTKASLEDDLAMLGAGRDTTLLAVGGGVTGDLGGFVAATWHRGIPLIQVPTSLLAMVDASIGGKTAVNLSSGKNLVGAYHQPVAVYADTSVLDTLPEPLYVDGFAEVVKTSLIGDAPLFRWLESSVEALLRREPAALEHVVERCVRIKSGIVRRDERETGPRAALNFGHTVAHAIETVSGYVERHGRAVAIGLATEMRLAQSRHEISERLVRRVDELLAALGLPTRIRAGTSVDALIEASYRDKKARSRTLRCALPVGLGRLPPASEVVVSIDEAEFREALAERIAPGPPN